MDAGELAQALADAGDADVVRLVADWIDRAQRSAALRLDVPAPLLGRRHLDALVAASAAYVARLRGEPAPDWTIGPDRATDRFWYPGPASLFPNALVHAGEFAVRGVFIEADSLASV